jgi:hypothetical protein
MSFVYLGKCDQRSEQSHIDKFSRMRKNAGLYRRCLNKAEAAFSGLATPWWDRRIPHPTTLWQEVTA